MTDLKVSVRATDRISAELRAVDRPAVQVAARQQIAARSGLTAAELDERLAGFHAAIVKAGKDLQPVVQAFGAAFRRMGEALSRAFRPFVWELVVDDPADRRPTTLRGVLEQMRDIVLHGFWVEAERPERSPGARYVRRRR